MPQGDPGGHFESTGGYGGNFGGAGGAARNAGGSGTEHGLLGFGGMSPGGYNATTYARNVQGLPGTPGFGARVAANRAAYLASKFPDFNLNPWGTVTKAPITTTAKKKAVQINPKTGQPVVDPTTVTPPTEVVPEDTRPYTGMGWGNYMWDNKYSGSPVQDDSFPDLGGLFTGKDQSRIGADNGVAMGTGSRGYHNPRQFGGPVQPGQQYTVGENGPETLQMGPGGGGQVIPHNPMDRMQGPMGGMGPRGPMGQQPPGPQVSPGPAPGPGGGGQGGQPPLGGMRPELMQQFHQLLQQWKQTRPDMAGLQGPDRGAAIQDWRAQRPERPQMPPGPQISPGPAPQPPQGGMGFGLSGLGQQGILGQMRARGGMGVG